MNPNHRCLLFCALTAALTFLATAMVFHSDAVIDSNSSTAASSADAAEGAQAPRDSFSQSMLEILHILANDTIAYYDNLLVFHRKAAFLISQGDTIARFNADDTFLYKDGRTYDVRDDEDILGIVSIDSLGPSEKYLMFIDGR